MAWCHWATSHYLSQYLPGSMSSYRVTLPQRVKSSVPRPATHNRDESRFTPSQWETPLQSNAVSHWLGANLEAVSGWVCRIYDATVPLSLSLSTRVETDWPPSSGKLYICISYSWKYTFTTFCMTLYNFKYLPGIWLIPIIQKKSWFLVCALPMRGGVTL